MQDRPRSVAVAMPYGAAVERGTAHRVLRNTYALLSLTLLFSAAVAAAAVAFNLPAPGIILTLAAYFGLLFGIHKLKNSGAAVGLVFALTGFMGWTLGPLLTRTLSLPSGGETVMLALGATGAVFLALSAYATTTKRDLSWMGGILFAGMIVALLAGLAAMFFQIPALALTVSAVIALLSAGLILYETQQIVNGGETNYVLATVSLFVSIFNLFASLLSLLGYGNSSD